MAESLLPVRVLAILKPIKGKFTEKKEKQLVHNFDFLETFNEHK